MHVHAVANNLGGDVVVIEHSRRQPGRAVEEWRHAIEEMRRVARTGRDCLERLLVRSARMPKRDKVSVRGETADEIDSPIQFRRDRDDPDVLPRALDLAEDFVSAEGAFDPRPAWGAKTVERLRAA